MKPLEALTRSDVAGIRGLLFDLDDTVLDSGVLTRTAYTALWNLHDAGLRLVSVTGRPRGFGEVLVRQWPIDAIVVENGGIALFRDGAQLRELADTNPQVRAERDTRLAEGIRVLARQFPRMRLASDDTLRRSDRAIDIGELCHLAEGEIGELERAALSLGFRTFKSTIHLHLTLEGHDKASGVLALLQHRFHEDSTGARFCHAFVGDSANDAACFAAFPLSFGVANVVASMRAFSIPPAFVSAAPRGSGFAQIAARLLSLRG